jgi:hypothetical protein
VDPVRVKKTRQNMDIGFLGAAVPAASHSNDEHRFAFI